MYSDSVEETKKAESTKEEEEYIIMSEKNLIDALNDEWWKKANEAEKWKPKFECMQEVMSILTGKEDGKGKFPDTIKDSKKSKDFLKIMTN